MTKTIQKLTKQDIGNLLMTEYSVGANIEELYREQVAQYPLYLEWNEKIRKEINNHKHNTIIEYGPGLGILFQELDQFFLGKFHYIGIEPNPEFRKLISIPKDIGQVVNSTGEKYICKKTVDIIIAEATYHHFHNKEKSIENISKNLNADGLLIIADGFIPQYKFDQETYEPLNHKEFIDNIITYSAEQIKAMPKTTNEIIGDQIRTTMLDIFRHEEYKVCVDVLLQQLIKENFKNISCELLVGNNPNINYQNLGYHFITAKKGD